MVWGMISAAAEPLIQLHGGVNAKSYQIFVRQHVIPSLQASHNQPAIFMQGNVPCYTAKQVNLLLEAENIEIMKWSNQSCDLKPIKRTVEEEWIKIKSETSDILWLHTC